MKRPTLRAGVWAGAFAFGLAVVVPAAAQSVLPPHPGPSAPARPRIVTSDEVLSIVRSNGFSPLERPTRRGVTYALRAVDSDNEHMRLIVDARTGRILSVTPLMRQRLAPGPGMATTPGPGAVLPEDEPDIATAPIAPGPNARRRPNAQPNDNYIAPEPPGAYRPDPPVIYEENPPLVYGNRPPGTVPPAPPVAGIPPGGRNVPPPDTDIVTPEPSTGLLPPPPERFPQRVAPGPEPKQKVAPPPRRTAAVPKSPPLPRPRPEASPTVPKPVSAPRPAAAPVAPAPAAPAATPPAAASPPADDSVPH